MTNSANTGSEPTYKGIKGYYLSFNNSKDYFMFRPREIEMIKPTDLNLRGLILCSGNCGNLKEHTPITIDLTRTKRIYIDYDKESEHPIFTFDNFSISSNPADVAYLSSDLFFGIGEKTAERIMESVGDKLYTANDADLLSELIQIPHITESKALQIIQNVRATVKTKEIYEFIYDLRQDNYLSVISNLKMLYGEYGVEKLKASPYTVGSEIGLTFFECDKIGLKNEIPYDDRDRIFAIIKEALERNEKRGNSAVSVKKLLDGCERIEQKSEREEKLSRDYLRPFIPKCPFSSYYIANDILYFLLKDTDQAENIIASKLHAMTQAKINFRETDKNTIKEIEKEANIEFNEQQKECFELLKSTGIKIILGGPGTGKTSVINGIIKYIKKKRKRKTIYLCAPTGNAAYRMIECTQMRAQTVHKMLSIISADSRPAHLDADYVIVDETSMVDVMLFAKLVNSLPTTATLVLVGDKDQIESVGAGAVLRDLLKIDWIEKYELTEVYRQKGLSSIILNANKINHEETDLIYDNNFICKKFTRFEHVKDEIEEIYTEAVNNGKSIQILSPVKKGNAGIWNLNLLFQDKYKHGNKSIYYENKIFYEKDKVVFTRNNYEKEYVNGMQGIITGISGNSIKIMTQYGLKIIEKKDFKDLSLSYAMTIHKSQGLEYEQCIIILPNNAPQMLKKNLLYTAVTRAKEKIYIYAQEDSLEKAIKNNVSENRKTLLYEKILKNC